MMREAGVYCEVEPRHLFNTLLPAAYLLQPGPRPNIVPDARMDVALPPAATTRQQSQAFRRRTGAVAAQQRPMLFDAKSIFAGGGRYRGSAEVREDQSGAVELRARQVPTEYRRTAREKDQQYGPAGSTLIQDRVASFGACRAVVFGNYGEASRDVHTLIHVAAQRLATKHWRLLGARSQGEVHGFYVAQLRRRMGVTAVREFARHRLRRAAYVGVPRAVVEQMMQQEAMRVRLHGQPAAEPPYADFFAWAGQQPAAARGGGGG